MRHKSYFRIIAILSIIISAVSLSVPVSAASSNTKSSVQEMSEDELMKLRDELEEKQSQLDEREKVLNAREEALKKKESEVNNDTSSAGLLIDGGNLKRIGNVTDAQVNAVINGFNQLPDLVQDTLVAANYRVEVTDEDIEKLITGTGTNSWYGASASSPLWVILIGNNQKLDDMTRTMVHESGHCFDDILGSWSMQPTWKVCYASEAKTLYNTALVHNEKEWFAECFVYYNMNPEYLKTVAPVSYAAMDTLMKDVYKMNGRELGNQNTSQEVPVSDINVDGENAEINQASLKNKKSLISLVE